MNVIIIILLVIAAIIILLFVVALFSTKDYAVSRTVVINKPRQTVFGYVKMVRNMNNYNKWWMMDPTAKKTYAGTDGKIGFIAAWDSDNKQAGKGEQETQAVIEGERIDYEVRFEKPFKNTARTYMTTSAETAEATKVSWVFTGHMKYPFNIMLLVMNMDTLLGKDIGTSLDTLKNILEK